MFIYMWRQDKTTVQLLIIYDIVDKGLVSMQKFHTVYIYVHPLMKLSKIGHLLIEPLFQFVSLR
jgi:hypothetical protein